MSAFRRFLGGFLGRQTCPHCGAREAGYGDQRAARPAALQPGMTIVCMRCARLIQVGPGRAFRRPTAEDLDRLARSPQAWLVAREQEVVRRRLLREQARGRSSRPRGGGGGPC